jgi:hypothetical protein
MDKYLGCRNAFSEEYTGTYFEKWPILHRASRAEQFENSPKLCGVVP